MGGLDNSQTTGIKLLSIPSDVDITKPSILAITYSNPINTTLVEWVTYTSIDGTNVLQGVTRGAEGWTAKTHDNGCTIAWVFSKSHVNQLMDALTGVTTGVKLDSAKIVTALMDTNGNELLKVTATASAVNELTLANAATGNNPTLSATGGDTDVGITITPKGAGKTIITNPKFTVGSDAQGDIYYRASGGEIARLAPGTSGQFLKTLGAGANPAWADNSGSTDGWTASSDTWTYASASTFTIAGVDRTTTFTKGTRLKFTQTSAKYAVVVASSFSTDTTVTIAVNTDYTIANAAITSPYYSYEASPQGYPDWFSFTTTWGGFSANPGNTAIKYRIVGKTIFWYMIDGSSGTSNATSLTFTLPVAAAATINNAGLVAVADNGTNQTTIGHISTTGSSATISVYKSWYQGTFTSSGAKNVFMSNLSMEY